MNSVVCAFDGFKKNSIHTIGIGTQQSSGTVKRTRRTDPCLRGSCGVVQGTIRARYRRATSSTLVSVNVAVPEPSAVSAREVQCARFVELSRK